MLDAITLARIQFATNISFHILFPAINIAMAWVLLFCKLRYDRTRDSAWLDIYRLWVKVFALSFALGVVSGVTMSFQFGTNWPGYMRTVGNIAGPLLAYEVLTAFFLEATFLSIMLFGMKRVSTRIHTLATLLVALGTTLSAVWILALNSWMQTPVGFEIRAGQAHALDWLAILFNPSMPYRLTHMLLASGLTVAFLIAGISSYRWLRNDRGRDVMVSLKLACYLAAILIPIQIVVGDLHGLNTLEYQPAKIAAIEGLWHSERGAPLVLFAWLNGAEQKNDWVIAIPHGASLLLRHSLTGDLQGLNEFAQHPPVAPVFWAFRIMVGMGMLMLLTSVSSAWRLHRNAFNTALARIMVGMTFAGWIAILAGWYVTEIGRQPYLVYGVLLTRDAASEVAAPVISLSLSMYLSLYVALILAYISVVFYLARRANRHFPEGTVTEPGAPLHA